VREGKFTVVGKGNKERYIYLNDACEKALQAYLEKRKFVTVIDEKTLLLNRFGERLGARSIQKIVEKYIKLAGLDSGKYSPHKLRHTAATLMYNNDVDLRDLQEILGHEQLSTTGIYTHTNDERLRNAVMKNPLANLDNN
jgi:site-specific recombinase XerD